MTLNKKLVTKGRGETLPDLLEQGKIHVKLAQRYAAELVDAGWLEEETLALERQIRALEALSAGRTGGRQQAQNATDDQEKAIDEAKRYIRRLRNALPKVLREVRMEGVSARSFKSGGSLGRSTAKISAYLNNIAPAVAQLDPHLARYFKGQNASDLLARVKRGVDESTSDQGVALAALPAETLQVQEAKGRLLETLEDFIRIGHNAFEDDPASARQFNKDILQRSRRAQPAAEGKPDPKAQKAPVKPAKPEQKVVVIEEESTTTEEDVSIH